MRVAIIDPSGFTPPYDNCLAIALAQQGCQVVVATTRMPLGQWAQGTAYERWEHFYRIASRLPKTKMRTYLKGCEHPFDMERLLRPLRRWRPDVIHFQWIPLPLVDGFFLRRFRKIAPLVLTVHDTEPFHGVPSSRLQLIGLESVFRCFAHYIVHTQYSKKVLVSRLRLPEGRLTVIPHGVFTCYREIAIDIARDMPQLAGKKKVLFFGVLKPYKGVDVLLEAFARVPDPVAEEAILQIVGYPRIPVEPLRVLARRLGIEERVFWDLRFVEEAEVAAYFAQADVVVLPYRRIDQSGVLMVALAFGKPIIASRVGGVREVIDDGVHGFLVEPGDVESLAQALARVLRDENLRLRMGEAVDRLGRAELSWEAIAERTLAVYNQVVEMVRS